MAEAAESLPGSALVLADVEPWDRVVDGAALLEELTTAIRRHVVIPEPAAHAVALWVVHTHALEPAQITPRLAILSPEKRCGKTTVLKVLSRLVRRPLATTNVTAAALFRTVEKFEPTVLVDEADTFLREREELRGVLNTGHDRAGARIIRCVGETGEPRAFATWAPVAIAALGEVHETIADRSIVVRIKRRAPNEHVAPFRSRNGEALAPLARKCARWATDSARELARARPSVPGQLSDRAADNWEPLLAIADTAGGAWPERARRAAVVLSGSGDAEDRRSVAEQLLADVQSLFAAEKVQRLTTAELLSKLRSLDGSRWATGKPLSAYELGGLLNRFSVRSRSLRVGDSVLKGYVLEDLRDAFDRYLPAAGDMPPLDLTVPVGREELARLIRRKTLEEVQKAWSRCESVAEFAAWMRDEIEGRKEDAA